MSLSSNIGVRTIRLSGKKTVTALSKLQNTEFILKQLFKYLKMIEKIIREAFRAGQASEVRGCTGYGLTEQEYVDRVDQKLIPAMTADEITELALRIQGEDDQEGARLLMKALQNDWLAGFTKAAEAAEEAILETIKNINKNDNKETSSPTGSPQA